MQISAIGLTDVGIQRTHNEDTFRILEEHHLYLVADGMGGHQAGDVASSIAAETIVDFFKATQKEDATWPFPIDPHLTLSENRLCSSIKMANKRIFDKSCSEQSVQGMGTTIVGLTLNIETKMAYIAHVGDSRAYRMRNNTLSQITRDHSLVNDYMIMMPDMPAEAMEVVPKNVITRALGMQDSVVVDICREQIVPGDLYLLCTDGLCGQVPDERIQQLLIENSNDLEKCATLLVQEANDAGGDDNATVVIVTLNG